MNAINKLCKCGCGNKIVMKQYFITRNFVPNFIHGHNTRGTKGLHIPWNKGLTKEMDERLMSISKKTSESLTGRIVSSETREKIRKKLIGYKHTAEARLNMSYAMTGGYIREMRRKKTVAEIEATRLKRSNSMKKVCSDPEYIKRLTQSIILSRQNPEVRKGYSERSKKLWRNQIYREKVLKAMIKGNSKRPTQFEKVIIEIIKKYNLPYKYVGDYSLFIGGKNPDFVSINNQKNIIEVYHDYFKIKNYGSCKTYQRIRSQHFLKYGYNTVFISTKEIDNENLILNKIKGVEK